MTDVARSGTVADWLRGAIRRCGLTAWVGGEHQGCDPTVWLLRADRYISATSAEGSSRLRGVLLTLL